VLLLDLDLQFGVVNDYLNIQPTYSLTDALANVADMDEVSLGSLVTKHDSGLHILAFKRENSHENYDKANQLNKLLPFLREQYPYIVVDLSRGLDRLFAPVISPASKLFMVTQQNLVAIKSCNQIIKTLSFEFGIHRDHVEILVNRYEKRQSIKLKDLKEAVGDVSVHTFPNDFKVALESANLGRPFVEARKGSALSKSVAKFVSSLLPQKTKKQSWLSKLFS
jgi:pilus assembly protein CpaE